MLFRSQQFRDGVEGEGGKLARHAALIGNHHSEEDVTLAVLALAGFEEALEDGGFGRARQAAERGANVIGRHATGCVWAAASVWETISRASDWMRRRWSGPTKLSA